MPETETYVSRLTIDLGAIARNYARLRAELDPQCECAPVVKADAYGLGAAQVAPALAQAGARTFFVAELEEAIALRPLLGDARIFVLGGLQKGMEEAFDRHRITPVLNSLGEIALWAAYGRQKGAASEAALHLDTGMCRLGLPPAEAERLASEPQLLAAITPVLLMTHLACADEPDREENRRQRQAFTRWRQRFPKLPASLANSSGIFLGPDYHADMVRPGAALYGVNPLSGDINPVEQVFVAEAKILQVRDVDRGNTVGYGAAHRVTGPARIATVALGYADGYLRSASGHGLAFLGDRFVPMVGRVSMDLITIDVTGLPAATVQPGAWVELIGPHLPVDAVAERAGTIGYEILTSLGRRYHRVWRQEA